MRSVIVCGVDESAGGRDAARVARGLADLTAAPLVLVHVVGLAEEVLTGAMLIAELARTAELGEVEGRVPVGLPAERLAEIADAEHAAFLVVGSRGLGRLGAAFLGSVSAELVGLAPCPVLVVPPGAADGTSARAAAAALECSHPSLSRSGRGSA